MSTTFHLIEIAMLGAILYHQITRLADTGDIIMAELDDLTAQVKANNDLVDSAVTLIQGLKSKLDAAGTDPAKLKALSDELSNKDKELADAIAANTSETGGDNAAQG